jgi:hypothetical protein
LKRLSLHLNKKGNLRVESSMSDANGAAGAVPPPAVPAHPPFPAVRLLYAFGFAILAYFVFWAILIFGALQFVLLAVNGRTHDDLVRFTRGLVQYEAELLSFITFGRDDHPFPFGPYPSGG